MPYEKPAHLMDLEMREIERPVPTCAWCGDPTEGDFCSDRCEELSAQSDEDDDDVQYDTIQEREDDQ